MCDISAIRTANFIEKKEEWPTMRETFFAKLWHTDFNELDYTESIPILHVSESS
jgi:hypothetical protein